MSVDVSERGTRLESAIVALTGQAVATVVGSVFLVTEIRNVGDFLLSLVGDLTAGGADTLDVVVEDSFDGTNWETLATFAQLSADGGEIIAPTRPPAPRIRATSTIAGAGSWDIDVKVHGQITVVAS